ncbi:hypothetical protein [Clostridium sp. CTA-7]
MHNFNTNLEFYVEISFKQQFDLEILTITLASLLMVGTTLSVL